MSHGSGDYAIAFTVERSSPRALDGGVMTGLFLAVEEATEEAILNSLLAAETTTGMRGRTARALPLNQLREILGP
jgi:D-aminopeptidase